MLLGKTGEMIGPRFLILCLFFTISWCISDVPYKFVEFPYKDTTKNEMAFREFESACEQTPACTMKTGPSRTSCVRECISPSCHRELYAHDPLEEGEIDVRLNSFKGCFIQRLGRPRQ